MNSCSALRLRINGKVPVDEFHPFFHAGETESGPAHCFLQIKADPWVIHTQLDLIGCNLEQHFELPNPTVLGSILEGFLQDPEETECNFLRQFFRNILGVKIDLDTLLL